MLMMLISPFNFARDGMLNINWIDSVYQAGSQGAQLYCGANVSFRRLDFKVGGTSMTTRALSLRGAVVRPIQLVACLMMVASLAFGQGGNGTITGTLTDPGGAVIPGATVEAKNTATGVVFSAVSTATGNYTIIPICRSAPMT